MFFPGTKSLSPDSRKVRQKARRSCTNMLQLLWLWLCRPNNESLHPLLLERHGPQQPLPHFELPLSGERQFLTQRGSCKLTPVRCRLSRHQHQRPSSRWHLEWLQCFRQRHQCPTVFDFLEPFQLRFSSARGHCQQQDIHVLLDQALSSLKFANPNCGSDTQTTLPIFAGIGKAFHHIDVFDRDETF